MRTGLRRIAALFKVASMSRTPLALKFLSVFIVLSLAAPCFAGTPPSPRERISFNANWKFKQGDPTSADVGFDQPNFRDNDWRQLDLPTIGQLKVP